MTCSLLSGASSGTGPPVTGSRMSGSDSSGLFWARAPWPWCAGRSGRLRRPGRRRPPARTCLRTGCRSPPARGCGPPRPKGGRQDHQHHGLVFRCRGLRDNTVRAACPGGRSIAALARGYGRQPRHRPHRLIPQRTAAGAGNASALELPVTGDVPHRAAGFLRAADLELAKRACSVTAWPGLHARCPGRVPGVRCRFIDAAGSAPAARDVGPADRPAALPSRRAGSVPAT